MLTPPPGNQILKSWRVLFIFFTFAYGPAAVAHDQGFQVFWVPVYPCTEYGAGTNLSDRAFIGILGGSCVDRRSANGDLVRKDVTNTFFRFRAETKYALNGTVWDSGFRLSATFGPETDKFRSEAGSEASVAFLVTAAHVTYLFRPYKITTLEIGAGYGRLHKIHSQRNISPSESEETRRYLQRNTESNNHPGLILNLGFVFL